MRSSGIEAEAFRGTKFRIKKLVTLGGRRSGILSDIPQDIENEKFFKLSPSSRKPLSSYLEFS